ncbi:unnamed protein product [Darwinula stevensoni]|uniref:Proteasome subunit beta n=1 Tax=Darwinula stevensoni TaxID=69355 RepID=A0A7R8X2B1_9CRUS|nr:unnamed protein product [Darwinula stevensoni]CAG0883118.1 unnamed protein product [Darwinula stevensoni]
MEAPMELLRQSINPSFTMNAPDIMPLPSFPAFATDFKSRTMNPITTGTSVVALKFDGGVMMAADTLGSYGSLARFPNIERLLRVNDSTIIGASGDYADYQYLRDIIEQKVIDEACQDDGFGIKPKNLHCWLTRVMYNRRSKFNPLWNIYVVAGLQDGVPYLGYVDKIGTSFEAPQVVSGLGGYLALPLLRDAVEKKPKMNQQEARAAIGDAMRLLFYRDCQAFHKYHLGVITKDGAKIEGPFEVDVNWDLGYHIHGY